MQERWGQYGGGGSCSLDHEPDLGRNLTRLTSYTILFNPADVTDDDVLSLRLNVSRGLRILISID